jgi:hypothetical protein
MFPSLLIRGIDLAIEFATLGEYGLESAPPPASRVSARDLAGFRVDLSGIGGAPVAGGHVAARHNLRASTFAARSRPAERHVVAAGARRRPGSARPRPQPCLVGDRGRGVAR